MNLEFRFQKNFPDQTIRFQGQFEFGPGRWVQALMGPSGIGKTTFARWVAGLESGTESVLRWQGEPWVKGDFSLPVQARRLGFLAQSDWLFPHLNGEQNVGYGLRSWEALERRARVEEVMRVTGTLAFAKRKPSTLSGGEKRRLAFAQALAPKPRFLILDEPFTGLDQETKSQFLRDAFGFLAVAELPTIWITHDSEEAQAFAAVVHHFPGKGA